MRTTLRLLLLLLVLSLSSCAAFTRENCTSAQIFNPVTLKCVSCPTNMVPNPSQAIPISCVCRKGYIADSLGSCAKLGPTNCTNIQFHDAINLNGSYKSTLTGLVCSACAN